MALQPGLDSQRQIGAVLLIVGSAETAEELDTTMVVVWHLSEGAPFGSAEEAYDAMEVTDDLLAQIDAQMQEDPNYVPDGFTTEKWAFFREALSDGLAAIEAEFPDLEVLESVGDEFDMLYDALVMAGVVEVPQLEIEEPVDLTD